MKPCESFCSGRVRLGPSRWSPLLAGAIGLWGILALGAPVHAWQDPELQWVPVETIGRIPARIAFGSCAHQDKPQPVLDQVVAREPDLFIYLGDNIYGDTRDMELLRKKYSTLEAKAEFRRLCRRVPILSIWDDHDYGWNDAGKEWEFREESKKIFADFWRVPADSPRRQRPGIYGAHRFREGDRVLQVILLDTRTFRDPLQRTAPAGENDPQGAAEYKNDYRPDDDPEKTLLGADQWAWLEKTLGEPADLRIICSSIQFGHEYNGWESWTNLPREQERMIGLIRDTGARGVIFISGDVHWGEISRRDVPNLYPLWDVTASGITEDWPTIEPNRYRMGEPVRENHFGLVEIDWRAPDPLLSLQLVDVKGDVRQSQQFPLSTLRPAVGD